jgi:hypothetical protein
LLYILFPALTTGRARESGLADIFSGFTIIFYRIHQFTFLHMSSAQLDYTTDHIKKLAARLDELRRYL